MTRFRKAIAEVRAAAMTADEAASALGVSKNRTLQLVRRGQLDGEKVGNQYLVDREAVEGRAANPPKAGNPDMRSMSAKRKTPEPPEGWMLVGEAAAVIGVSEARVRELMRLGRLEHRKLEGGAGPHGASIVSARSVERHIAEGPRKPGRKPRAAGRTEGPRG